MSLNKVRAEDEADLEQLKLLPPDDLFRVEAERLAKLSARDRKEALAVHRRIADDARLSQTTRDHARLVAETLEALVKEILKARG
jgi:hypothetical protein